MTTIHTLHTTIQFPGTPGDDLLPDLSSFRPLWPNLEVEAASWDVATVQHPMLHPITVHATDALNEELQARKRYQHACDFHTAGNSFLAAHWVSISIQQVIASTQLWMDVAGILAQVEVDVPALARMLHPLLHAVGRAQQRLLTLLAILQGVYFLYCQSHSVVPTLISSQEGYDEDQEPPTLLVVPAEQRQREAVQQ